MTRKYRKSARIADIGRVEALPPSPGRDGSLFTEARKYGKLQRLGRRSVDLTVYVSFCARVRVRGPGCFLHPGPRAVSNLARINPPNTQTSTPDAAAWPLTTELYVQFSTF